MNDEVLRVAVAAPVLRTFDYAVAPSLRGPLQAGSRVLVPFGGRRAVGFVLETLDGTSAPDRLKPIAALMDETPVLEPSLLRLLVRLADYYMAPPGEMLRAALPAGARPVRRVVVTDAGRALLAEPATGTLFDDDGTDATALLRELQRRGGRRLDGLRRAPEDAARLAQLQSRGLVAVVTDAPRGRSRGREDGPAATSALGPAPVEAPLEPTGPQAAAIAALGAAIERATFSPFLLFGVTGSGKTEVYQRAIAQALACGRGALVLVPEIALTPQLTRRFRARFGDQVAVLHSALSDADRLAEWRRVRDGSARIALGARSAVFAPVADPGVIVVDEEHDGSFKQEDGVRYHARDAALLRGQEANAVVILGSATPSLESFQRARSGQLTLLELPARATVQALPAVEIVDLRKFRPERESMLSAPLAQAIADALDAREQVVLFLNRRGYDAAILCSACGLPAQCRHCSVALSHHRARRRMLCHYCGYSTPVPSVCPACRSPELRASGIGTEKLEAILARRFPAARIERLDRDTASARTIDGTVERMRAGRVDILVGTQMVTKGHDFPGVTLVGILLADIGLGLPDFRAGERLFQLLAQVAGRAGRGDRPGRVLIQTYNPGHPSVSFAARHDYRGFAEVELAARRDLGYPPFGRLVAVRLDGADPTRVEAAARTVGERARVLAAPYGVGVLGPVEAPIARLRGRTRWQLLLRASDRRSLHAVARRLVEEESPKGVRLGVDVDPQSTL